MATEDVAAMPGPTLPRPSGAGFLCVGVQSSAMERNGKPCYPAIFSPAADDVDGDYVSDDSTVTWETDGVGPGCLKFVEGDVNIIPPTPPPIPSFVFKDLEKQRGAGPPGLMAPGCHPAPALLVPTSPKASACTNAAVVPVGSVGHATGTCRPCAFIWKPAGCYKGDACERCHFCDEAAFRKYQGLHRRIKRRVGDRAQSTALFRGFAPNGN